MRWKKRRHRTPKFFGFPEDSWARLCGRWGKKRSYGHFAGVGNPGGRTVAEIRDADDRRLARAEEKAAVAAPPEDSARGGR